MNSVNLKDYKKWESALTTSILKENPRLYVVYISRAIIDLSIGLIQNKLIKQVNEIIETDTNGWQPPQSRNISLMVKRKAKPKTPVPLIIYKEITPAKINYI